MRKTIYTALLLAAALIAGGCKDDNLIDGGVHIPAINQATLTPTTDASGTRRAYIGTEISVGGFNLDKITAVTIADVAAEITEQTIKSLKFKVPALELAQQDQPYEVLIAAFGADASKAIFTTPYYVSVPVTDARVEGYSPAEGTVGTEIILTGRNLEQITRVHFGETVVEASAFSDVQEGGTDSYVKFLVPAGNYTAADTEVAIAAEWGTSEIDVTGDAPFTLHVPVLDPLASQAEGVNSLLGDELDLTGRNLDLIESVKWGGTELIIAEQSATDLRFRFPATIEKADPAVQTRALTAEWGTPAQAVTLSAGWRLDTTPSVTVLVPEMTSMTAEDGGADNRFYLRKKVTVAGKNLTAVEGIELRYSDGAEFRFAATILDGASDMQLEFTVPDQMAFTEATEMRVVAIYNGGDAAEFGRATVYPFYYWPNITIGAQDASNRDKAFFVPDLGRVISSDEWKTFDTEASTAVMSNKNVVDKSQITEEEYYAVGPYFMSTFTGGVLTLQSPAGSNSQLKNIKDSDNKNITGGSSAAWYGTSICAFRNISAGTSAAEKAVVEHLEAGTLVSMAEVPSIASSTAPKYGDPTTSTFGAGQIIVVEFPTYAYGQSAGMKAENIYKFGYIRIKESGISEAAPGSAASTITFDFYWSKTLNK